MKKTILLFAFVLQVCLSTLSAATPAMRQLRNFDFDWKFIQSDDPTFSQDSLHGVAFAQPHSGATTFMFNLTTSIGELMR